MTGLSHPPILAIYSLILAIHLYNQTEADNPQGRIMEELLGDLIVKGTPSLLPMLTSLLYGTPHLLLHGGMATVLGGTAMIRGETITVCGAVGGVTPPLMIMDGISPVFLVTSRQPIRIIYRKLHWW